MRLHLIGSFKSNLILPLALSLTVPLVTQAANLTPNSPAAFKVMIDPGHGGVDSGATKGEAREASICLQIAKNLNDLLNNEPGYKAQMTRTTDKALGLPERVKAATLAQSDLFISIHANSNEDKRAHGVQLYFQNHLPPDEETMFLAAAENQTLDKSEMASQELNKDSNPEPSKFNDVHSIVEDLARHHRMVESHALSVRLALGFRPHNVTIRQAPFYVITRATIPSVLIEVGFLTNGKESAQLLSSSFQKELAQKIYQGIKSYRQNSNLTNPVLAGEF